MHIKKLTPTPGAESPAGGAPLAKGLAAFAKRAEKPEGGAAPTAPAPAGKGFAFFGSRKPKEPAAAKPKGLFIAPRDETVVSDEAAPVAAPEAAPASSSASLLKRFGGPRKASADAAQEPKAEKPAASSLLGRFGSKKPANAAPVDAAEKPVKEAKAPKAPKAPKAAKPAAKQSGRKSTSVAVLVELEDGRQLAWQVSREGIAAVEMGEAGTLLSFSPKDQRFSADIPLSNKAAEALAIAEIGEDVRMVNASKALHAVYATTTTRVTAFGGLQVGPGLLVLESLMPMSDANGQDRIGGLQLMDADGSIGLVVLYHINAQGEIGAPQVTVNPGDLGFVLSQFVAARRLNQDSTQVVLAKNEDLLRAAEHFKAYPSQPTVLGMPLSAAQRMMAFATLAAAMGAGGYAGYGHLQLGSAKAALSSAMSDKSRALAEADALLQGSLVSFAKTQALDAGATLGTAQAVWVPGAKVSLEASLASAVHLVELPLSRTMSGGGAPSVLDRVELDHVKSLIDQSAPEGCSKSVMNLTGGMNAVQITFECQNTVGGLLSYRLD